MPSSTSSSERLAALPAVPYEPQPAPVPAAPPEEEPYTRPIPAQRWTAAGVLALTIAFGGTALWEWNARRLGYVPAYNDTVGLWAIERRQVRATDQPVVAIGSSRTLFDLELSVWEELTGRPLIQLANVGTSVRPFLADLADDESFAGLAVVGVTEILFLMPGGIHGHFARDAQRESPSSRLGQRLAMMLERRLAFLDTDNLALSTVVARLPMRNRPGVRDPHWDVWKLANTYERRQTLMWARVEDDPAYREHARGVWSRMLQAPPPFPVERLPEIAAGAVAAAAADVDRLRARGGEVVFVRFPSTGPFYEAEQRLGARELVWEPLIERTGAASVHFEDHPELQGYDLPEWSHLAAAEVPRFTRALVPLVQGALCRQGSPWAERLGVAGPCASRAGGPE
jgi:hypothetical protein